MHARFRSPLTGRFLSVDPVGGSPQSPQSWNRYTYVRGNPLKYTDPTGEITAAVIAEEIQTSLEGLKQQAMNAVSTGGVGGVVAATAVGFTLDLASTAADLLKAGDATGTAIGSGASAGETAIAVGQDALRTAGFIAPLAGAGRAAVARGGSQALQTTAHGAQRVAGAAATRGGVLSETGIAAVRQGGRVMTQADGATVRILQNEAGRFNVVVEGERGIITTFENLSQKSLDRLGRNYGWN